MSAMDDLYFAIQELEYARSVISDRLVRGTNDPLYDWCKGAEHRIRAAKAALNKVETKR